MAKKERGGEKKRESSTFQIFSGKNVSFLSNIFLDYCTLSQHGGGDRFACESVQMSTFRNGHFGSMFPIEQNLPTGTPGFELVASLRLSLQSPTMNPFLMTDQPRRVNEPEAWSKRRMTRSLLFRVWSMDQQPRYQLQLGTCKNANSQAPPETY